MKVGIAGTGRMGPAMAQRLMSLGHELTVWNRTPEKPRELAIAGAAVAPTPAALATKAEVSLTLDNILQTSPQDNGSGIWPYYWAHLQNPSALGRAAYLSMRYSFD